MRLPNGIGFCLTCSCFSLKWSCKSCSLNSKSITPISFRLRRVCRGYLDVSLPFECVFCFPVDWSENQGERRICSLDESERLSLIVHYYVYEPNLLHSIVLSCLNKRLTSLRCCLFRVMHRRRCRRQCVLRCTTMQHSSTWGFIW